MLLAATFTVTNTLDNTSGGSLRWAIGKVNHDPSPGIDTIQFAIPGTGPFVIRPSSALPTITHTTLIDGYTQSGAQPNSQAMGDNAAILIQLDGVDSNSADGLTIAANNSVVRGLAITNFFNGIHVLANSVRIVGDFVGTDTTGTASGESNFNGVFVDGGSGNSVGGTALADRNVISGSTRVGALFDNGATGNIVQNSYIGVDKTGSAALGNQTGVTFNNSPGNTLGGAVSYSGNVISGNSFDGVDVTGLFGTPASSGTVIIGNLVGTDASGSHGIGDGGAGVYLIFGSSNIVGGTSAPYRNIISANSGPGINVASGGNLVQGNYVGTDASGLVALGGNTGIGLSAPGNTIGGTSSGAGNLISGNGASAIFEESFVPNQGNVIQGNLIGTDRTGEAALGNGGNGIVLISNADLIGGTLAGAGNVIAANNGDGIQISSATGSLIQGNLIGTELSGTHALGNAGNGIDILNNVTAITIGGTAAAARNVIAASAGAGIVVSDGSGGILIQGNSIGTDATGAVPLGNSMDGVFIVGASTNNTIGGVGAGAGNIIANSGAIGVAVASGPFDLCTGNAILSNSIYGNAELGIDLGSDGVTLNSPAGVFTGPNQLQNFPVLFAAVTFQGNTSVKGMLNSIPNTTFQLQFFSNPAPDPSGYGQGQALLATTAVATDAGGNAVFQLSFPALPAGQAVSATATDPNGNTSEFSADVPVVPISQPLYAVNDAYNVDVNTSLVVTSPGVLGNDIVINGGTPSAVLVGGPAHGSVTLNADGSFSYTPTANFLGADSFTYQDVLGAIQSNVATVNISVNPKILVVTNTNDSGPGSLRQAIEGANLASSPLPDSIDFDIPGTGPFTIVPATTLPAILHATIIDGYSQPNSQTNTLAQGDNAVIQIVLDSGSGFFRLDGLTFAGGGSTVDGLKMTRFKNAIHLARGGNDQIVGDFLADETNGVFIDGIPSNTIGGNATSARDIFTLSGSGVLINGSGGNLIENSYFGTDATGTQGEGNTYGVQIQNSSQNTVGGNVSAARNLFGGNGAGVLIVDTGGSTAGDNLVEGNYLGTDVSGENRLANGVGVRITDSPANTVGGSISAGAANVISGNNGIGVQVNITSNPLAASGNLIVGNLIGTDAGGTASLGNAEGIILQASDVVVGGTSSQFANVISGNSGQGVIVFVSTTSGDLIEGNLIGTDASGSHPLGNGAQGVFILFGASNNTVGGLAAGAGNVIANNGAAGVAVGFNASDLCTGNAILSNSIFANAHLGIDLGNNGVTPNTPGGPHSGPNDLQNSPVLSSAVTSGKKTTIQGTLNSIPSTSFTLQFFSNPTADPSGHGQGQTLLGTITVMTDSSGNASFTATFSPSVPVGQVVSATATDPSGNTSEFAQDLTVVAPHVPAIAIAAGMRQLARSTANAANSIQNGAMTALTWTGDFDLHDLAVDVTLSRLRSKRSR
jgi:hypothetical protein